jgi:hypothetical protein
MPQACNGSKRKKRKTDRSARRKRWAAGRTRRSPGAGDRDAGGQRSRTFCGDREAGGSGGGAHAIRAGDPRAFRASATPSAPARTGRPGTGPIDRSAARRPAGSEQKRQAAVWPKRLELEAEVECPQRRGGGSAGGGARLPNWPPGPRSKSRTAPRRGPAIETEARTIRQACWLRAPAAATFSPLLDGRRAGATRASRRRSARRWATIWIRPPIPAGAAHWRRIGDGASRCGRCRKAVSLLAHVRRTGGATDPPAGARSVSSPTRRRSMRCSRKPEAGPATGDARRRRCGAGTARCRCRSTECSRRSAARAEATACCELEAELALLAARRSWQRRGPLLAEAVLRSKLRQRPQALRRTRETHASLPRGRWIEARQELAAAERAAGDLIEPARRARRDRRSQTSGRASGGGGGISSPRREAALADAPDLAPALDLQALPAVVDRRHRSFRPGRSARAFRDGLEREMAEAAAPAGGAIASERTRPHGWSRAANAERHIAELKRASTRRRLTKPSGSPRPLPTRWRTAAAR